MTILLFRKIPYSYRTGEEVNDPKMSPHLMQIGTVFSKIACEPFLLLLLFAGEKRKGISRNDARASNINIDWRNNNNKRKERKKKKIPHTKASGRDKIRHEPSAR